MTDLPYAGTSGWSGSETSRQRAENADSNGTTTKRQAAVITWLAVRGDKGLTWKDLSELEDWHHGQSSGTLSALHKVGRIQRLTETRDRCAIYVLPEFVNGRETSEHGSKKSASSATQQERESVEKVRQIHNTVHQPKVEVPKDLLTDLLKVAIRSLR